MSPEPPTVAPGDTLLDAAREMRDGDPGPLLVADEGGVEGILTDHDIVVRAVADGRDPASTTVGEVCSANVMTIEADEGLDAAARLMREQGVRRLPVVDGGRPVGIVSIDDLTP